MGTVACVAGASVITLYKGPTIFGGASKTLHATYWVSQDLPSLGDANAKNWTLGCIYLIGHCLSWSGWLVFQAPVLKKYPARLSVTSYTCFFGVLQFLAIAAFIERDIQAWMFHSGGEVFTILYAVLYSIEKTSQLTMLLPLSRCRCCRRPAASDHRHRPPPSLSPPSFSQFSLGGQLPTTLANAFPCLHGAPPLAFHLRLLVATSSLIPTRPCADQAFPFSPTLLPIFLLLPC